MLASCLLCIPHKNTTSKEERLQRNKRLSFVTNYWNPFMSGEILEQCDEYLKPEIRQQLESIWTGF